MCCSLRSQNSYICIIHTFVCVSTFREHLSSRCSLSAFRHVFVRSTRWLVLIDWAPDRHCNHQALIYPFHRFLRKSANLIDQKSFRNRSDYGAVDNAVQSQTASLAFRCIHHDYDLRGLPRRAGRVAGKWNQEHVIQS